jgi:hypothetical protein
MNKTDELLDRLDRIRDSLQSDDKNPLVMKAALLDALGVLSEMLTTKRTRFTAPTVEEVRRYCAARDNAVDPQHFVDYYAARGWRMASAPIKDWKACVRTWERREDRTRQETLPI